MKTAEQVLKSCMKYRNFQSAYNVATRHATFSAWIVMIDCPYYAVVTGREAGILRKAGYEIIPISEYHNHL